LGRERIVESAVLKGVARYFACNEKEIIGPLSNRREDRGEEGRISGEGREREREKRKRKGVEYDWEKVVEKKNSRERGEACGLRRATATSLRRLP
jgi:hypothetical protein